MILQVKPAEIYARITPRLAGRPGSTWPTRAHAWVLRRSRGRIGTTLFGSPLLVLRTVGRKSGQPRESPMLFVEHADGYAVVASNAASPRPPAWWLNLQAQPDCVAFVAGRSRPVRARKATESEAQVLWPKLDAAYVGFEHYREVASREIPVVILEPRGPTAIARRPASAA
jgi:deazaflavin-dependent oxidoreductase (nitroreductase family)